MFVLRRMQHTENGMNDTYMHGKNLTANKVV